MTETVPKTGPRPVEPTEAAPGEGADLTPAQELDCRGLNCPLPILKTKKAIDGLSSGQILKMVATDPGSVPDVAAFSRRTGHQIVQQSEGEGEFAFWIRKT